MTRGSSTGCSRLSARGSAQRPAPLGPVSCRHASARQIHHGANFLLAFVDPSGFELSRMFARWLTSLDGERQQMMRRIEAYWNGCARVT
jgi:hypothetical protein